ncbi:arginine repressor [Syntrophomonas wolfei]|jgi:transcriptional regulator of arginine metabolism|uniref:arginine repressor n=1 Tax=Syntrophomonas wolfei TaxID=863 RepID=UPI0023F4BFB2|nr:arginine repressor [Syntrophomonas wolfei]
MKLRRQLCIIDIISQKEVGTQEELCETLKNQGFDVTQATVSRDIKELKLIKVADKDGYHYALPDTPGVKGSYERMKRVIEDSVLGLDYSENLIVIKTLPGSAHAVASLIDSAEWPTIIGTVAGDDTILAVVKPKEAAPGIVEEFEQLMLKSNR